MTYNTPLKRLVIGGITAALFVGAVLACRHRFFKPVIAEEPKPAAPAAAAMGDWPMFGGSPQRNFVNTHEKNIPDKWDVKEKTNLKWSADLGSWAYGGPVVAGGNVFVGTNNDQPRDPAIKGDKGVVMCFDEKSGKFLWQLVFDKLAAGRVQDWPEEGICSSPTVEGDRLYFVSNRCEVVCADVNGDPDKPGKGKILWTYDMIDKQSVFPHNLAVCSPLIVGNLLFVVTANGVDEGHINLPAPQAPSFLCLKKKDGEFVWKSNRPSASLVEAKKKGIDVSIANLKNKGKLLMHGQWSNPTYAEADGRAMVIFPGGDGWIYAFKPDNGDLLWKFDCNPKDSFYKLGPEATRNDFIGTPVLWENKLYIGVGQDPEHKKGVGHLWCIDITKTPKNADKDVSPQDEKFDPKDPKNKESALVWHYGGVTPKGSKIRRAYLFGRSLSTCAVHDGLCYTADLDGYVYCFDAKTGERYWDHDTSSQAWGSPYWVDGKIYFGTDDGTMYIFEHGKKKKDPVEIEMAGMVRATPIAANGTLFVLTENKTRLLAIGKK
jgi:outer membrane protein assembly factor BamB